MAGPIGFLYGPGLHRVNAKKAGDKCRHALIDLGKKVRMCGVQRIVEVKQPRLGLGKLLGIMGQVQLGHGATIVPRRGPVKRWIINT